MASKIIKIPPLANGTKVALPNCVETGVVLCRMDKGKYMVLYKGHELAMPRQQLSISRGGKWVPY